MAGIAEEPVDGEVVIVQIEGYRPRSDGDGVRKHHAGDIRFQPGPEMDNTWTGFSGEHRAHHMDARLVQEENQDEYVEDQMQGIGDDIPKIRLVPGYEAVVGQGCDQ